MYYFWIIYVMSQTRNKVLKKIVLMLLCYISVGNKTPLVIFTIKNR